MDKAINGVFLCLFIIFPISEGNDSPTRHVLGPGQTLSITSPNYPHNYPNDAYSHWLIEAAPPNRKLNYRFIGPFSLIGTRYFFFGNGRYQGDCWYDSVNLFDSATVSNVTGRYCGSSPPPPGTTSSRFLYVVFASNESLTSTGFNLEIISKDDDVECGSLYSPIKYVLDPGHTINIKSPNYPNNYSRYETYYWLVQAVSPYSKLNYRFIGLFSLQYESKCAIDSVTLYDSSIATNVIGSYCGSTLPTPGTTTGSYLYIIFTSMSNLKFPGFQLEITSKDGQPREGYVNFENGTNGWNVTKGTGTIIRANFNALGRMEEGLVWFLQPEMQLHDYPQVGVSSVISPIFPAPPTTVHDKSSPFYQTCQVSLEAYINSYYFGYIHLEFVTYSRRSGRWTEVHPSESSDPNFVCRVEKNTEGGWHSWTKFKCPLPSTITCPYRIIIKGTDLLRPNKELTAGFALDDIFMSLECFGKGSMEGVTVHSGCTDSLFNNCGSLNHPTKYVVGAGDVINIASPNYPLNYESSQTCHWLVEAASPNSKLNFRFVGQFSIEGGSLYCDRDSVVLNDSSTSSNYIVRYCGSTNPAPAVTTTTGRFLHVIFTSDATTTSAGFKLEITTNKDECGSLYAPTTYILGPGQAINITSPNYPNNYQSLQTCHWLIQTAPPYSRLNYRFIGHLARENHRACVYDYVALYESKFTTNRIGGYCGSTNPYPGHTSTTTGSNLYVIFKSDATNTFAGFKLEITPNEGGVLYRRYHSEERPQEFWRRPNDINHEQDSTVISLLYTKSYLSHNLNVTSSCGHFNTCSLLNTTYHNVASEASCRTT